MTDVAGEPDLAFLEDETLFDAPEPEPEVDDEDDGGEPIEGEPRQQSQQAPLTIEELQKRNDDLQKALRAERGRKRAATIDPPAPQSTPQQSQTAEPEAIIDPEKDPIGALQQAQRLINEYRESEARAAKSQAETERQNARYQRIDDVFRQDEADFEKENPDFKQAAGFFLQLRQQELNKLGVQGPEAMNALKLEIRRLTFNCVKNGESPSQVLYDLAKGRGYKGSAQASSTPGSNPNLDRIRSGVKSAQSPLARNGGTGARGVDPASVARINIHSKEGGDAFDKAWAVMERQAKAAERGRR